MAEPWDEVASRIAFAVAEVERLLDRDEDWRALAQLAAREAAGDQLEAVEGALVKARLLKSLSGRPAYRVRERLLEARRLAHERADPQGASALCHAGGKPAEVTAARQLAPTDDLTRIRGIDARLAAELARVGVEGYAAIATWGAEDVRRVSDALGLGRRISRENWIEQAALLAARRGSAAPVAAPVAEAAPLKRSPADEHDASFAEAGAQNDAPSDTSAIVPGLEIATRSPALPVSRDILLLAADLGKGGAPLAPERPETVGGTSAAQAATEPPAPPVPIRHLTAPPPIPLPAADAGTTHAPPVASVPMMPQAVAPLSAGDAGAHPEVPDIAVAAPRTAVIAQPAPAPTSAGRTPLPCAAIFAAPLSSAVPFIGPEGGGGRAIPVPLKDRSPQDVAGRRALGTRHAEAAEPRPVPPDPPIRGRTLDVGAARQAPPSTRSAPARVASPREVLGGRVAAPARPPQPTPAPRTRSDWSASESISDAHAATPQPVDEAEVEIVQKTPGERPLPRPEPRGRLPKRAGPDRLPAPRTVLKDVEAAEVVIVPRCATPPDTQAADAATAARGRLDVGRLIATWRGR